MSFRLPKRGWTTLRKALNKKSKTESLKLTSRSTLSELTSKVSQIKAKCHNIDQQKNFDIECQTRIEREKDILQALDDEKYKLHKKIDDERTDKSLKFGAFRDDVKDQLKRQHKYVEEFQKKSMDEFKRLRE